MSRREHREPTVDELITPELHQDALWLLDVCGKRGMNVQRMLRAFVGVEIMAEEAMKKTRNAREVRLSGKGGPG